MPDVTPKTESRRAWLERQHNYELWHAVDARRDETTKAILAIEQEAASTAVAEVLDAAEAVIEWLGPCDHFDHHGNCQTHAIEKPCRVEALRAALLAEPVPLDAERTEEQWRERIAEHLGPQRRSIYMGRDLDMMARGAFLAARLTDSKGATDDE